MPDTPALQEDFGQPGMQKPGCGFPVMHVLALFHAATGCCSAWPPRRCAPTIMSGVGPMHPDLAAGDVLVGDRAFCSFAHLALLAARQVFGVFRVHQQQIVDFRPRRRSASSRSRQREEVRGCRRHAGWQAPGPARSTGRVPQAQERDRTG